MAHSETDAYLSAVLEHVRWKNAHSAIRRELCDHMEDARLGFLSEGIDEETAAQKAVLEMGDAAEVGLKFDAVYRPKLHLGVWIPLVLLFIAGIFGRVYLAQNIVALSPLILLAPIAFAAACFIRFERFARYAWHICALYILLFVGGWLVFSPRHGITYWNTYTLLLFPVVYALLIDKMRGRGMPGLLTLGALFLLQAVILLALSTLYRAIAFVLVPVCLFQLLYAVFSGWLAVSKKAGVLMILLPTLFVVALLLYTDAYRAHRLYNAFFPEQDPWGTGYQAMVVRGVLKQTPWFGMADLSALALTASGGIVRPHYMNDYLLVVLASKLGRFVFIAAGLMFAAFFAFALRASVKLKSMLYRVCALGLVLIIFLQCVGYFAANLGYTYLFLVYPLPFVSEGDAALLINCVSVGLLFSLLYNGMLVNDEAPKKLPRLKLKLVREYD